MQNLLVRKIGRRLTGRIEFSRPPWGTRDLNILSSGAANELGAAATREAFVEAARRYLRIETGARVTALGSGRGALRLGLQALIRAEPGRRKVVLPTYCCGALLDPVLELGLEPVFVDTSEKLVSNVDQYLAAVAEDVLCLIVVNLCGKRLRSDERGLVIESCRAKGVVSIEDNCHYFLPISDCTRPDMEFYSLGFGKMVMATAGGILISRGASREIDAELTGYESEPAGAAEARFQYLWAKYGNGGTPESYEEAYKKARTQYGPVTMSAFDAALAMKYMGCAFRMVNKQAKIGTKILSVTDRYPQIYGTQGAQDNIFTRLPIVFKRDGDFERFWTHMYHEDIGLEGMYVPLHLKGGEMDGSGRLRTSEYIYRRVFNVPNRPSLSTFEVTRVCDALESFVAS